MSRWRKPPRPVPQRHLSLWRGCLYAYCAGWEKGYREDGTNDTASREDVKQVRGRWVGSLDENNYARMEMGRVLDEGLSDDKLEFADLNNVYDVPNGYLSAFVATRPETIQNSEQAVFSKEPDAGPPSGWGITVSFAGDPNPNGWHFQIHDGGVKEFSVANEQNTGRSDVLTMVYNKVELVGYINGVRRGSVAATGNVSSNDVAVILFADGIGTRYQGHIGVAAMWNRPLAPQEVQQLYADPYIMWRPEHREFMFGPGMVPAGGGQGTYFLIF